MSVIEFHIWPEDNPVGEGNKLGVITDEDVVEGEGGPAIWYEPSLHGLGGVAGFSISRHSALATSTIIREDNFVRVKVPQISSGYLPFAWYMKTGQFHLIDSDEAGGENITIEGPGLLHKLATGSLYHSSTVSDQPARGSANRDGLWWWIDEPYGAMLTRAFEEGRHAPYPDPAEVGSPLEFFEIDFDRVDDSDGNPWPNIDAEFQVDIGTDLMTLCDRLRESGNLYVIGDASDVDTITVHCYQTYGEDKTGPFGAGTVRFEKAINIATELVRTSEAGLRINKLLLRDSDGNYSTETLPGFSAGDVERWGFWDANQTNDDTLLNAIGRNVLLASQTTVEPLGFEQVPGKVPTEGLYLAGLHYNVGDSVTLHTGTDPEDYDDATQIVVAYRVSIREGSTDDTAVRAQRSLKIEPQLNYYSPRYGASNLGESTIHPPGCRCIHLCVPGTVVAFERLGLIGAGCSNSSTDFPSDHPAWSGDNEERVEITAAFAVPAGASLIARTGVQQANWGAEPDTVYDERGNTWTKDAEHENTASSSDDTVQIWRCNVTNPIGAGDYIRWALNLGGGGGPSSDAGGRCIGVYAYNAALTVATVGTGAGTFSGTPSISTPAGDLVVAALCVEDTVVTADGDWLTAVPFTDIGGSGDLASGVYGQDLLLGGATTWTPTLSGSEDWAAIAVSYTTAAGEGLVNDGNPDLVGTATRAARCDHRHDVHRASAPTVNDDWETAGYKLGTIWAQLDDLENPTEIIGTWMLVDIATGAAVWLEFGGGGGVTDHGDLTGLLVDDHTQYVLKTDGGKEVVNTVAAAGSTETLDLGDGNWQDITLSADCTFTLTGATNGVGCSMLLLLRQDGTGGWDATWPGSVAWPDGVAPTLASDPDAMNIITLVTDDGGATWFGAMVGSSGGATALSDLTDVTITAVAEGDMLRYDGSVWVNTPGRWELLVVDGVTSPPDPIYTPDGTDFVYAWVDT